MSKNILILGASKGIGSACATLFRSQGHTVTGIARSGPVEVHGDISNGPFRDSVINNHNPDIMINCVGGWGNRPYGQSMHLNAGCSVDLMLRFYEKMPAGSYIINLSSLMANFASGWEGIPAERIAYMASKRAMTAATTALAQSKRRNVHVVAVEPGEVHPTNFGEWKDIPDTNYTNFEFDRFTPYRPSDIAEVVNWIVTRPPWFGISQITLNNHCLRGK